MLMKGLGLVAAAALFAAPWVAAAGAPGATPAPHAGKGKMVLVALTGPEDLQRLAAPFRHAVIMKKAGKLEDVAIVMYGRSVLAVSTLARGIPDSLRSNIKEAHDAGVRIYVCEHALLSNGIPREALLPEVETVPQGAAKIAELVSQGYVPMQY